ncbi:MAG: acyl-CoA dehydrogenase family protein, partial [Mycobacterium sp.]|nr:acyl-CoA dehydrogenase family protein [Mycobacterium sp.]
MGNSALAITDEHNALADAATGLLQRLGSRAAARATLDDGSSHPAGFWTAAAELGWQGLAIPEAYGGSGFGLPELAVVLEVQGRELCPGPFLPSVVAATVIDRCAAEPLRARLLPGLADGSTVAALGRSGEVTLDAATVSGSSPAVLGAPDAALLVIVAGDDVVVVDADADGVTVTPLDSLDTTRSIGAVTLQQVTVAPECVLRGAAAKAHTAFRILAAAEAVGTSWAALDMAVEYAKVREQFVRTIGTFQ